MPVPVKLSIIIPTLNVAATIENTIASLSIGNQYFNQEIIMVDCGSSDASLEIAKNLNIKVIIAPKGRGGQIAHGVMKSDGEWILLIHGDTSLDHGWALEIDNFIQRDDAKKIGGYFKFSLDDNHPKAVKMAKIVAWRARVFGLPYGDQAFFLSRKLLNKIGGISPIELMEDVDMVRRIGRKNLYAFNSKAITSAVRYLKSGYYRRACLHLFCLFLYFIGLPIKFIVKIYG